MKLTRMVRIWDRTRADYVEIPIQHPPDTTLSCKDCRYFDIKSGHCLGVGSSYYMNKVPQGDYVPRYAECQVRLPPDLLSFVSIR